jgi:glycosyltransferase involved in cell wall biosynthesis
MSNPSICFVALNAYNLIAGRDDLLHVGGAERQQWLVAKWFLSHGYRVKFIVLNHGQKKITMVNGFEVISAYDNDAGLPGLRFVYPRLTGLWRALSISNCDVYYQRGAGLQTGQIALWCKWARRKFIFACAADSDCQTDLPLLGKFRERVLYRYGLRHSDRIIVQTESQRRTLQKHYGLKSAIVRNMVDVAAESDIDDSLKESVLWVGRIAPQKRFEWLLDLAEAMPEVKFEIVGGANSSSTYAEKLVRRSELLPNVTLYGAVPHEQMSDFYRRAKLLCITSSVEGFPNVALEAWSAGIPVASTFDPDDVIKHFGLGWHCESLCDLVKAVRIAYFDSQAYDSASAAGRAYCERFHTAEANMPVLVRALNEVLTSPIR